MFEPPVACVTRDIARRKQDELRHEALTHVAATDGLTACEPPRLRP